MNINIHKQKTPLLGVALTQILSILVGVISTAPYAWEARVIAIIRRPYSE